MIEGNIYIYVGLDRIISAISSEYNRVEDITIGNVDYYISNLESQIKLLKEWKDKQP